MKEKKGDYCPQCNCPNCILHPRRVEPTPMHALMPCAPIIPRNYQKIRSVILSGKNAFIPRLPRPLIREACNHAYVLPSECIRHYLANGNMPMLFNHQEHLESYRTPSETPRGVEISKKISHDYPYDNNRHLALSFVEWKDDCEASKSNKAF